MAKGYDINKIKSDLVELLSESNTGMSGLEISQKLKINRITMTKYLNIFATEKLIKQKNVGNAHLWFIEEGTEQFQLPDDYFRISSMFNESLSSDFNPNIYSLIRNCHHSGGTPSKIITEIIVPGIKTIHDLYSKGHIGAAEKSFLSQVISDCLQIINVENSNINLKKNIVTLSADSDNKLLSESVSVALRSLDWNVFSLGDMSSSIDVLLDLDFQKFLAKIWKNTSDIMIIAVFSSTDDGMKFFAESINSIRGKFGKHIHLILCGNLSKNTKIKSDLITNSVEEIIQWSESVSESTNSK